MPVIDARNSIIEYLSANNMVAEIEEREQEVPVSERGKKSRGDNIAKGVVCASNTHTR